jgi:hypothetical protein
MLPSSRKNRFREQIEGLVLPEEKGRSAGHETGGKRAREGSCPEMHGGCFSQLVANQVGEEIDGGVLGPVDSRK